MQLPQPVQSGKHRRPCPAGVAFLGAAGTVGGSLIAVRRNDRHLLLECGRVPGARAFPEEQFPPLDTVDGVVISHAHHDHAGWLAELARRGYRGPVVCTPATRDLIAVQFDEDERRRRVDAVVSGEGPDSSDDARRLLDRVITLDYHAATEVSPWAAVTLTPAGHLLGSASVRLTVGGGSADVFFSGDVGRDDGPFFAPPVPYPEADLVISESTYGDRTVPSFTAAADRLAAVIREATADGGRVVIPVFSLGRTQSVLAALSVSRRMGALPVVPIAVDSSIAAAYSAVYKTHDHLLMRAADDWEGDATYAVTDAQSRELVHARQPIVVLAAGGMCDGGPARRHLRSVVDDPRCRIVLVSYQAPGTLGRQLLTRGPTVRFDGRNWNKWAVVEQIPGFSGHADRAELIKLIRPAGSRGCPVRLVHGEMTASHALASALREAGCPDVAVPVLGDRHSLMRRG